MNRTLQVGLSAAIFFQACTTTMGPRLPLPPQDLNLPVPAGYARVIFFNDTFEGLNWATGTMRIRINGQTAPSLYLNHYAQLFLKPGEYELVLEHWDLVTFTDRYRVYVESPKAFFRIWTTPLGNKYESVETLPSDFESRFIGGRDPSEWPAFEP